MYETVLFPYPVIETEHLILRKPKRSDAADMFELCRRPETSRYSLWSPHKSVAETKDFISYKLSALKKGLIPPLFAVAEKDGSRVIGTASYVSADEYFKTVEIGYSVLSDLWNRGYGTEIANGLMGYAFDRMEVQRVFARVLPPNVASARVLEKLGFVYEGHIKKGYYFDGRVSDVDIYAVTDDMYFNEEKSNGITEDCKL